MFRAFELANKMFSAGIFFGVNRYCSMKHTLDSGVEEEKAIVSSNKTEFE
jgi:hypothetical protein